MISFIRNAGNLFQEYLSEHTLQLQVTLLIICNRALGYCSHNPHNGDTLKFIYRLIKLAVSASAIQLINLWLLLYYSVIH